MSALTCTPGVVSIADTETLQLAIDLSNQMAQGDSVASPAAKLVRTDTGADVSSTSLGTVGTSGNDVTVIVKSLTPGLRYQLQVTCTLNTNKTGAADLGIYCPW